MTHYVDQHNVSLARPADATLNRPNCGVVAMAAAFELPYQAVETWWRRTFRKSGNWKGRTFWHEQDRFMRHVVESSDYVLEQLGTAYRLARGADGGAKWESSFDVNTGHQPSGAGKTLQRWAREHGRRGRYLVWTTGHVQVVEDGRVLDQGTPVAVDPSRYRWRRKIVRKAIRVDRAPAPSDEFRNRSDLVRAWILAGVAYDAIVAEARERFPEVKTARRDVLWLRRDLVRRGRLTG